MNAHGYELRTAHGAKSKGLFPMCSKIKLSYLFEDGVQVVQKTYDMQLRDVDKTIELK